MYNSYLQRWLHFVNCQMDTIWTQWTRARINITALWCHTVKFLIYTSDKISNKIQILDIWKVNGMALVRNCIQHNPHIYTKWAPSTQCHVYNADCYTHRHIEKRDIFSNTFHSQWYWTNDVQEFSKVQEYMFRFLFNRNIFPDHSGLCQVPETAGAKMNIN